jgi:hypothetical protein
MQKAGLKELEESVFRTITKGGYERFLLEIETIEHAIACAEAEDKTERGILTCAECRGDLSLEFRNALNERVCYDPWEHRPRFCKSEIIAEQKKRQAIDLAREQLRQGEEFSVHPKIARLVVKHSIQALATGSWLQWENNRDAEVSISTIFNPAEQENFQNRLLSLSKEFGISMEECFPEEESEEACMG